MYSTPMFYVRIVGLSAVLTVMIGYNFAVWGTRRVPTMPVQYVIGANPDRGPPLIRHYGCGSCHVIPGVAGAVGDVGPRLDRVGAHLYVAGALPNNADNLAHWIRHPQQVIPQTAMPDLGVSQEEAEDIAAYLYRFP